MGMGGQTDWQNSVNEINFDWQKLSGKAQREAEKAAYAQVPTAFTMVRDGTQFPACCNKCVGCCILTDCCADGMTMVAGSTAESSTKEIGAPLLSTLDDGNTLGSASVPVMSAFFSPTLHVMERGGLDGPFAKVEGPCLFGGCSEFCCSFNFPVSKFGSPAKAGDIGKIGQDAAPNALVAASRELRPIADHCESGRHLRVRGFLRLPLRLAGELLPIKIDFVHAVLPVRLAAHLLWTRQVLLDDHFEGMTGRTAAAVPVVGDLLGPEYFRPRILTDACINRICVLLLNARRARTAVPC